MRAMHLAAEIHLPEAGTLLGTLLPYADFNPVREWLHLQSVRRGLASLGDEPAPITLTPRWDETLGPPYVSALRAAAGDVADDIPVDVVAPAVQHAVDALVTAGRIREGARYTWRLQSFGACDGQLLIDEDESPAAAFAVAILEDEAEALPVRSLADLLGRATPAGNGTEAPASADVPVFLDSRVLAETEAIATAAGERESGGILLGTVARDPTSGALVIEISAQVAAHDAVAEADSLRFTPRTWAAVHQAIRAHGRGLRRLGWWHSHPPAIWACRNCPAERRERCASNVAFFSAMDVEVHRTAFAGAEQVALLMSFHDQPRPRHDLFGWRKGMVLSRSFHILEEQ